MLNTIVRGAATKDLSGAIRQEPWRHMVKREEGAVGFASVIPGIHSPLQFTRVLILQVSRLEMPDCHAILVFTGQLLRAKDQVASKVGKTLMQ